MTMPQQGRLCHDQVPVGIGRADYGPFKVFLTRGTPTIVASTSMYTMFFRSKHTLPDLPYDYSALEPVISAEIMQLHHSKHHQVCLIHGCHKYIEISTTAM